MHIICTYTIYNIICKITNQYRQVILYELNSDLPNRPFQQRIDDEYQIDTKKD